MFGRAMYSGNIDPDIIIHYFVHGGESCNFAPQF